jgi:hypothetical protein
VVSGGIGLASALIVPESEPPLGQVASVGRMEIVTVTGRRRVRFLEGSEEYLRSELGQEQGLGAVLGAETTYQISTSGACISNGSDAPLSSTSSPRPHRTSGSWSDT